MTQYDSSVHYYKKYNEAVPDDNHGYFQLAYNYANQGKISDAISVAVRCDYRLIIKMVMQLTTM